MWKQGVFPCGHCSGNALFQLNVLQSNWSHEILVILYLSQVFRETMVKGFDQSKYQTIQVFYPSKDGTQIPMFIVHKKVSCTLVQHNCRGLLRSLNSDGMAFLSLDGGKYTLTTNAAPRFLWNLTFQSKQIWIWVTCAIPPMLVWDKMSS